MQAENAAKKQQEDAAAKRRERAKRKRERNEGAVAARNKPMGAGKGGGRGQRGGKRGGKGGGRGRGVEAEFPLDEVETEDLEDEVPKGDDSSSHSGDGEEEGGEVGAPALAKTRFGRQVKARRG